jgi:hypothetical protein
MNAYKANLKNPRRQEVSLNKGMEYFAAGGHAEIEKMKKKGRFGDTEMALIPSYLADHLDRKIGGKSINPKTGHREYFMAAALQAAPAIMGMFTAPPPTGMKGVQGSLTSSIGSMMGGLNPTSDDEDKTISDYERGLKARYINSNPELVNKFAGVGIKPEHGNFNGADIRKMELAGYLAPKKDTTTNENMRDSWAQTKEAQRYFNAMQQNMQQQQAQQMPQQYNMDQSNDFSGFPSFENNQPQFQYNLDNSFGQNYRRGGRIRRADGGAITILESNPGPTDQSELEDPTAPMIVCHFSQEELQNLDEMQGGKSIDPATGFREYRKLANVLSNPELRVLLDEVAMELKENNLDPELQLLSRDDPKQNKPYAPSPSDFNPEVLNLESKGIDGDDEMALLPLSVADYFDDIRGKTEYNPNTGLRQYKWFDEFIRVGATVAGAAIGFSVGGFTGASIGAGLGTAAGNAVTGAGTEKSLRRGIGVGAATHIGTNLYSAATGAAGAATATDGAVPAPAGPNPAGPNPAAPAGPAPAAASGGLGGLLSNPMLMGAGAMLYLGHQDAEKQRQKIEDKERENLSIMRHRYGIESKPMMGFTNDTANYDLPSSEEREMGIPHSYAKRTPVSYVYANGGSVEKSYYDHGGEEHVKRSKLIEGPGKGQDDHIPVTLEEGDYVVDASTTSMIGDGSSKAGGTILDRASKIIEKASPKRIGHIKENTNKVPALLSDSEFVIKNPIVTALGDGDNKKGSDICREAIKKMRKAKSINKEGLPPKLGPLWKYIPKDNPLYNDIKKVGRHA